MAIIVSCPSCAGKLSVGEHLLGKRVKCPKCSAVFPVSTPADAIELEQGITESVAITPLPVKPSSKPPPIPSDEAIKMAPPPLPSPPAPQEELYEDDDEDFDRSIKKKGKKKKKRERAGTVLSTQSTWQWWVFGGGGIVAVEFSLLVMAVFLEPGHLAKPYAAILFVMLPLSTVIFFAAMWISSVYFGALEIGEIHVALVKAFILSTIVNVVGLVPCGFIFTLLLWWGGILTLYRLDPWEARILVAINWLLNLGLKVLIVLTLASLAAHGVIGFDVGAPPRRGAVRNVDDN